MREDDRQCASDEDKAATPAKSEHAGPPGSLGAWEGGRTGKREATSNRWSVAIGDTWVARCRPGSPKAMARLYKMPFPQSTIRAALVPFYFGATALFTGGKVG